MPMPALNSSAAVQPDMAVHRNSMCLFVRHNADEAAENDDLVGMKRARAVDGAVRLNHGAALDVTRRTHDDGRIGAERDADMRRRPAIVRAARAFEKFGGIGVRSGLAFDSDDGL